MGQVNAPVPAAAAGSTANGAAITPSDTAVFSPLVTKLYVGTTGTLTVIMAGNGASIEFTPASGSYHDLCVSQVKATGTSATGIIGYW